MDGHARQPQRQRQRHRTCVVSRSRAFIYRRGASALTCFVLTPQSSLLEFVFIICLFVLFFNLFMQKSKFYATSLCCCRLLIAIYVNASQFMGVYVCVCDQACVFVSALQKFIMSSCWISWLHNRKMKGAKAQRRGVGAIINAHKFTYIHSHKYVGNMLLISAQWRGAKRSTYADLLLTICSCKI